MRQSAGLSELRDHGASRDPDCPELLLHAVGDAQGSRRQRAQHARAADAGAIQGLARSRLRLLLHGKKLVGQELIGQEKAGATGDQDQERRQGFSDRAALDDQSLIHAAISNRVEEQFKCFTVTSPAATTPSASRGSTTRCPACTPRPRCSITPARSPTWWWA